MARLLSCRLFLHAFSVRPSSEIVHQIAQLDLQDARYREQNRDRRVSLNGFNLALPPVLEHRNCDGVRFE